MANARTLDLRARIGKTVLFTAVGRDLDGADPIIRPALVVEDWRRDGGEHHPYAEDGSVNLVVFLDGTNDNIGHARRVFSEEECRRGTAWRTSVPKGEPGQAGTWHDLAESD